MKAKKTMTFTEIQRQVLYGILLGDAHLETANGKTYRLVYEQSLKQKAYFLHVYDIFKEWIPGKYTIKDKVNPITGRVTKNIMFRTSYSGRLRYYAQQFYKQQPNGQTVKCVPTLVHRQLSKPLTVAYWFMDDGSRKGPKRPEKVFNTQGFTLVENQRLAEILTTNFDIECSVHKDTQRLNSGENKIYYKLYITAKGSPKLLKMIRPYTHSSMLYKID
nr:hypothetical protein [Cylindrocapsa geminella]